MECPSVAHWRRGNQELFALRILCSARWCMAKLRSAAYRGDTRMSSYFSDSAGVHDLSRDMAPQPEPRTTTRVLPLAPPPCLPHRGRAASRVAPAPLACTNEMRAPAVRTAAA